MSLLSFIVIMIAIAAIVYFLRALPFLFAKNLKESRLAQVLARSLPLAIMLLLSAHGVHESERLLPALLGVGATAFMHLSLKQPIVSILTGTAVYVALLNYFSL